MQMVYSLQKARTLKQFKGTLQYFMVVSWNFLKTLVHDFSLSWRLEFEFINYLYLTINS